MRKVNANSNELLFKKDKFKNTLATYSPLNNVYTLPINEALYTKDNKEVFVYDGEGSLMAVETVSKPLSLNHFISDEEVNLFFLKKLNESFLNKDRIVNDGKEKEAILAFKRIADLKFKRDSYIKFKPFDLINKALLRQIKQDLSK